MPNPILTILELAERHAHAVLTDNDIGALFAEANRLQGALETANLKVQRLERDNDRLQGTEFAALRGTEVRELRAHLEEARTTLRLINSVSEEPRVLLIINDYLKETGGED